MIPDILPEAPHRVKKRLLWATMAGLFAFAGLTYPAQAQIRKREFLCTF